jgi:ketosteroid isomerase-like protein
MPNVDELAKSFTAALQRAEKDGDTAGLLPLFAPDARVSSIALKRPLEKLDGVAQFWTSYLAAFKSVASRFVHIHASGDLAVLEWISDGLLSGGEPISYQGVSILEFECGRIARFRTYYDSAAFLPDGAKLLGREVEI